MIIKILEITIFGLAMIGSGAILLEFAQAFINAMENNTKEYPAQTNMVVTVILWTVFYAIKELQ